MSKQTASTIDAAAPPETLHLVEYEHLNSKQKEIFNFQKIAAVMAHYGFNCIKLQDDWEGADFLAYHFKGKHTLKVQLKPRMVVADKYKGKELWIAFPDGDCWYLVNHDRYIDENKNAPWSNSNSWVEKLEYTWNRLSENMKSTLQKYKLGSIKYEELKGQ